MRKFWLLLASVAFLWIGGASASLAAPLSYTGSISVGIGTLTPIPLGGAGVASVSGSTISLPAGIPGVTGFAGRATIPLTGATPNGVETVPNFPLVRLQVVGATYAYTVMGAPRGPFPCPGSSYCTASGTSALNATGNFGGSNAAFTNTGTAMTGGGATNAFGARIAGGGIGGPMGVLGVALVGALGSPASPAANVAVPLSVLGAGGNISLIDPIVMTVQAAGAPWTTGTATIFGVFETTVPTPNGGTTVEVETRLTAMGGGSAVPGGRLTLVTPLYINTAAAGLIPAFGTLTLNFVPEPGTLALLGLGIAGISAVASRRSRR